MMQHEGTNDRYNAFRCWRVARNWAVILMLAVTVGVSATPSSAGAETPTVERITADLMSRDIHRIQRTLKITTVRVLADKTGRKQFILDLWRVERSKYPDLPWDIIMTPQVRVYLANILVPVVQTGRDRLNPDDILNYAWNAAESPDDEVVRAAFNVVAGFDEARVVRRIERYLSKRRRGTYASFYGAVWALAEMCNKDASRFLDKLETREIDRERLEIIADARRQWEEQKKGSGYCK